MHIRNLLILLMFLATPLTVSCGPKTPEEPPKTTELDSNTPSQADSSASEPVVSPPIAAPEIHRGQVLYKRCRTCHTLAENDRHKVGPNLYGIFGATAGSKDGFNYSATMKESGLTWTDENLKSYIENPKGFMPGNRMSFVGLRKSEDVDQLLDYMKKEMSKD